MKILLFLSLIALLGVSALNLNDNKALDYLSNYGISINSYNTNWWLNEQIMQDISWMNPFDNGNKRVRFTFRKIEDNIFKIKSEQSNLYCGRSNNTYTGYMRCFISAETEESTFKIQYNPTNDNFFIFSYIDSDPSTVYALKRVSNGIKYETLVDDADLTQDVFQFNLPITGCKNGNYVQEQECVESCKKDHYVVTGDYNLCVSRFLNDNTQAEYLASHSISINGFGTQWWQNEQIMLSTTWKDPLINGDDRVRFRVEIVQDNKFKIKNDMNNVYCGRSQVTYAGSFRCITPNQIDDTTYYIQYNSADDAYNLFAYIDSDPDTIYAVRRSGNSMRIDTLAATADLSLNKFKFNIPVTGCLNGLYNEDERCVSSCSVGKTLVTGDYNLCI